MHLNDGPSTCPAQDFDGSNTVEAANRLLMHDGLMCHGFSVICAVIEGVCLV